ncbi:TNF receptor-associated factor 4-like [Dysidea avara]|uniref:TNF receptor-associated factor 4-like n=1 Tax=Dysidea avara TaxID=196820 RepID=UPI003323324A
MATTSQGGYEHDFVDVDTLPDRLVCQICHYPCREARLTGCCGAHFCYSCLSQIRRGSSVNKACPMCRVERFKDFPNKQLDREIKGMRVYCLNRKNGCTWVGEINDATAHSNVDCQFVDVYCPSRCGTKLKKQCVNLHLAKDCPCYCKYCGASGNHVEIALRHKQHCHMYPVPCPNGCELGITGNVGSVGIEKHKDLSSRNG